MRAIDASRLRLACALAFSLTACDSGQSDPAKNATPSDAARNAATETKAGTADESAPPAATTPVASPDPAVPAMPPPVDLAKILEGDWADRLLQITLEHEDCAARLAPLDALATEANAAGQPAWAAETLAALASCHATLGNKQDAIVRLSRAIELGFADCGFLRTNETMKSLAGTPGYRELLDTLQTTAADVEELTWIVAEYSAVFHDIAMIITEQVNRADSEITRVSQSTIPTRSTSNQSVVAARAMLAAVQRHQQAAVLAADKSRVEHNTSMAIIGSIDTPSSRSTPLNVDISRLAAAENAGIRHRAVEARAFKPSAGSATPLACSAVTVDGAG